MTDEFRAHAELRNIRPQKCFNGYKAEEYLAEFDSLVDQLAAYKRAVIVLEDGAEPEVGDIVQLVDNDYAIYKQVDKFYVVGVKQIIQRSGLPCIYKSNLKKDG